ncbi:MAG: DoxX family protein [Betaproteobacteria bacterium]|nr:DoxX family protein [Betaproteobacteria bacterium]
MNSSFQNHAALVLRVALGIMFIAHGLQKLLVFGLAGTAGFFVSVGFPGWLAYIVAPFELLAGTALVLGVRTRVVALASLPLLLGALSVHSGNGWSFTNANGGWEYPAFLVAAAVTVALLGDGIWALSALRAAPRTR